LTDFERLLAVLSEAGVEFMVGGLAANAHGAIRATRDIDVVYARSPQNLTRLEKALAPWSPRLRGAPPGLPFRLDAPTLGAGLNFTLSTDLGDLDLLGEVTGGGSYEDLAAHTRPIELLGSRLLCLDLETLIAVKRAAGRPKDLETVAELEVLKEERDARERSSAD
jgi:hypothetical protein